MTYYAQHQSDVERGWKPYEYSFLLEGAPLFRWREWFTKLIGGCYGRHKTGREVDETRQKG